MESELYWSIKGTKLLKFACVNKTSIYKFNMNKLSNKVNEYEKCCRVNKFTTV